LRTISKYESRPGIGRFFEPFSFENVSPEAAYLLNLPLQRTEAQFDLKPERDTQLELGGHIPVGTALWAWARAEHGRPV
jgi:hypothetical protein